MTKNIDLVNAEYRFALAVAGAGDRGQLVAALAPFADLAGVVGFLGVGAEAALSGKMGHGGAPCPPSPSGSRVPVGEEFATIDFFPPDCGIAAPRMVVEPILASSAEFSETIRRARRLLRKGLERVEGRELELGRLRKELTDSRLATRELRHRVVNTLQAAQDVLVLIGGAAFGLGGVALEELESRINSLLAIQEFLGTEDTRREVPLPHYLRTLTLSLQRALVEGRGKLGLTLEGDGFGYISEHKATALGLTIHELVMNALKHCDAPFVKMELSAAPAEGGIRISFEDAGVLDSGSPDGRNGFAAAASIRRRRRRTNRGVGMKIVNQLIQRSGGRRLDDGSDPSRFSAFFPIR